MSASRSSTPDSLHSVEAVDNASDYLIIGKAVRPFGVRGEVKLLPITDRPERFKELEYLYIQRENRFRKVRIERARVSGKGVILKLEGLDTREQADLMRNRLVYVDREHAAALDEASFYYYDILGCMVATREGEELGTVEDIRNFGSCDIYVVRRQGGEELLVPAIRDVITSIDVPRKRIEIVLVEGLLE